MLDLLRRRALLLVALVAVVALAIGYLGGLLTPSLTRPGDNSPEAGFARDMSTHHAQAVEMAMIAWQKTTDPEIGQMAYNIATVQQGQIGVMQTWLNDWHLLPTGTQPKMAWMPNGTKELLPDGRMPGMASDAEIKQLGAATGKQLDILFCQLMIRHHLGGIHMVSAILALSHDTEVTELATGMRTAQQMEVTRMREKLSELGAQALGS
jgi:uncharacterized protein (DUF305 family)